MTDKPSAGDVEQWIDREFTGHGLAVRTKSEPPIPGEPLMSMAVAKDLTRRALRELTAPPVAGAEVGDVECVYHSASRIIRALSPPVAERGGGGVWQPIKCAPKDGADIIVFRPNAKDNNRAIPRVGIDFWFEKRCWGRSNRDTQPTHWMPMPAGPATPTPETGDGSETIGGGE